MYYATHDCDGERINLNANIHAFNTREEAEAWLRQSFGSEWDQTSIRIEPGCFSDCWIKAYREPGADCNYVRPFTVAECSVSRPGSHPGGRAWWITPHAEVLVVTDARELD